MVFLKEIFKKVTYEKKADDKKACKIFKHAELKLQLYSLPKYCTPFLLYSVQRVKHNPKMIFGYLRHRDVHECSGQNLGHSSPRYIAKTMTKLMKSILVTLSYSQDSDRSGLLCSLARVFAVVEVDE